MTCPVRVLQIFSSLDAGGAESRMMDVYRRIDREKFQFDFLSMRPEEQFYEAEIRSLGGSVFKIRPPRESGITGNIREMYRVINAGNYDAVHVHTSFHCALACLVARLAGVPVRIAHGRTTGSQNSSWQNKIALYCGRLLIPLVSNVRLAISNAAGCYLFPKKRFTVLPNAIDCGKYQNVPEPDCQKLKAEFNIPANHKIIGMVGRFNSMKNHAFALKWFAHYHRNHPESTLVLVGDAGCGYMGVDVRQLARDNGISADVVWTGARRDVHVWMNLFDVLIVPSLFEGLGGVILEAQAAGTPVVKSDTFTDEADMGLGLVESCSLQADLSLWDSAVNRALTKSSPTGEIINEHFAARKYSLDYEIEFLSQVYSGRYR